MQKRGAESQEIDFDCVDFHRRWERARISALKKALDFIPQALDTEKEFQLLTLVRPESENLVLKLVFDHSFQLGKSLSLFLKRPITLKEIKKIITSSNQSCHQGVWQDKGFAFVLEREGCDSQKKTGKFYCQYSREAMDGLTMGACKDEGYARHKSVGHGDENCVDVFYSENARSNQFGGIAKEISEKLEFLQEEFEKMNLNLVFDGIREGTLFYQLTSKNSSLCGSSEDLFHRTIQERIKKEFPLLIVQNRTPKSVLAKNKNHEVYPHA